MKITIASGKGGTGKTTIATNLAVLLSERNENVCYADCDVEEPNGHIFLKPQIETQTIISVPVPNVSQDICTFCGKCGEICAYKAILCLQDQVLVFPELCHGCGGCMLVCPTGAIQEIGREVGFIEKGNSRNLAFIHGKLRIGESMSPPLIKNLKKLLPSEGITIIDSPPGTACPAVASVIDTDFVLLATEPTPFGLNDFKLAVNMIREIGIPIATVINRSDMGNEELKLFCIKESIKILAELPDDRRVAEAYSRGELAIDIIPEYKQIYANLANAIEKETGTT